ncbi:ABC transporter permease protein [Bacillus sp. TS-2]|nr:ABC transporter permease protein [Bacillus sp. TS-2]
MKSILKLWDNKDFILTLSKREINSKYKQSLLGRLWIIISPLGLMAVMTLVFSIFVKLPSEGLPYAPFLFVALLPFMYFNSAISESPKIINGYAGLIRQRNFYRPSLVFIKFFAHTINFFFTLIGLVLVLIIFKIYPGINALFAIPILFIQMMLILGVMFIFAGVNAYVRDFGMIAPLGLRLMRYLSPIMYSYRDLPIQFQPFLALNPLTGIFDGYRQTLLHNQVPDLTLLSYSFIFSLVLLVIGWSIFMKLEKNFADVV